MVLVPIKKVFDLPTEGTHRATIIDVVDEGEGPSKFGDGKRDMICIVYSIDDQVDADGELIELEHRVTNSIIPASARSKQSEFYKLLTVGLGIVIPKAKAFDADTIKGRSFFITVQHKTKKDKNEKTGKWDVVKVYADVVDYPKTAARRQVATVIDDMFDGKGDTCKTN